MKRVVSFVLSDYLHSNPSLLLYPNSQTLREVYRYR